jgi:queuine tRNA-ribosyltransferase
MSLVLFRNIVHPQSPQSVKVHNGIGMNAATAAAFVQFSHRQRSAYSVVSSSVRIQQQQQLQVQMLFTASRMYRQRRYHHQIPVLPRVYRSYHISHSIHSGMSLNAVGIGSDIGNQCDDGGGDDDDDSITATTTSTTTSTMLSLQQQQQQEKQQQQPIQEENNEGEVRNNASIMNDDYNNDIDNIVSNNNTMTGSTTATATATTNTRPKRNRRRIIADYPPLPQAQDFPHWSYEARDFFHYEILHQSNISQARVGRIHTPHGTIDTPAFVAVATNGALKGLDFQHLSTMMTTKTKTTNHPTNRDSTTTNVPTIVSESSTSTSSSSTTTTPPSSQLIFCNTYHLMIQPGADVIGAAGGIHAFTKRYDGPFITDSGGFQVFSLAYGSVAEDLASKGELKRSSSNSNTKRDKHRDPNPHRGQLDGADAVQVTEDGAIFRSYRDGSKLLLTPETTIQAQKLIGADIIIPLDELPGYYVDRDRLVESVARTHRWEARSLQEHLKDVKQQAIYCVIHGGMDYELRKESVDYLTSLPFDGYGIGGSLGNGRAELQELLSWLMPMFNENDDPRIVSKPRHLLGIADEESIRSAIPTGIDTFDSCYPTRLGRHGTVLSRNGTVKLQSGIHARSFGIKIDDACTCTTCQTYDRAYLCHLFKANEPIATTLAATHNLRYMYDLMAQLRQDILDNKI